MAAVVVVWLAASRACDGTDALPDVRPPGGLDGAVRPFFGVEGRGAAGASPGGRGAAAPEPQAEAGLVGLDYLIWLSRACQLGPSLSDLLGRLPARALPPQMPDSAGAA